MSEKIVISLLVAAGLGLGSAPAAAQSLELRLEGKEVYAGVPFVLGVIAQGFDEDPEPKLTLPKINGVKVTPLGVTPESSTHISIVSGRQSVVRRVTWVYRYKLEASRPGTYRVPALTAVQGRARATSRPGTFTVRQIQTTRNMALRVRLPDRPLSVGESFELRIDWYVNRDPRSPSFSIPLFDATDKVLIKPAPAAAGQRTLSFAIGATEVELPYTTEKDVLDGVQYTRFRFRAMVTPKAAGVLDLPAASVVAQLASGIGRDRFGFQVARYQSFKAMDAPRELEIRPLPLDGRPPSFENAVGTKFSIKVSASRTVVRVGDPVELQIRVRSDSNMDGMSLPRLGKAGLSADQFAVPDEMPPGEATDDGKLFRVNVRVKSKAVQKIPPIAFSYYDPTKSKYFTVKSEPIALQVEGASVVGADEVVAKGSRPRDRQRAPGTMSLVGADLSLSARGDTLRTVLTTAGIRPYVLAGYVLGLLLLAGRLWQLRTREGRGHSGEVKERLRALEAAIEGARKGPARDSAPRIAAALRALSRVTGHRTADEAELFARLETEGYSPKAATEPLDAGVVDEAAALGRRWAGAGRRASKRTAVGAAVLIAGAASLFGPAGAGADDGVSARLEEARDTYKQALDQSDRAARLRLFARAELAYRALVERYSDRPELLTDWGNAALGAHDLGRATLAYRRALHHDRSLERARRNLSWVRQRAPEWLPRPQRGGAIDSLFFWHTRLGVAQRHLGAVIAFAVAVLLVFPWGTRRDRLMRRLAIVPGLVCIAMLLSAFLEPNHSREVVVIADSSPLRSGDSEGAPPVLANTLPAGTEAEIVDSSPGWVQIALSNGASGWLKAGAVQRVVR